MSKALMLQGTGSDVGKSLMTAALCRIAVRRGLRVAPFKPQNMSNNAAVCGDGGEIGRAQALQARAAGLDPNVDMNPVLLKPETDRAAQVVVHGRALTTMQAADYIANRNQLMDAVLSSFQRLKSTHDLVVVEGAGSPAEVNLRARDIANMGFARRANVPVVLIGDIDKGGVIASLVGTKSVLSTEDAAMIRGFFINKFRGDPRLFDDGVTFVEQRSGWPCFGVVPWLSAAGLLPAEDAVSVKRPKPNGDLSFKVVAPMLSRMANFDDADPLRLDPNVDFEWIPPGRPLPRDADLLILFGTKSTLGDLEFLRAQGWDYDIHAHARCGGSILGICGGFQMLGQNISDVEGFDGVSGNARGLGLLDVDTVMTSQKQVTEREGICAATGLAIRGYEIHTGRTEGPDTKRPFANLDGASDGARSANGRIQGTYLHGMFSADAFRRAWLNSQGGSADEQMDYDSEVDQAIDRLADGVEAALDIDAIFAVAR